MRHTRLAPRAQLPRGTPGSCPGAQCAQGFRLRLLPCVLGVQGPSQTPATYTLGGTGSTIYRSGTIREKRTQNSSRAADVRNSECTRVQSTTIQLCYIRRLHYQQQAIFTFHRTQFNHIYPIIVKMGTITLKGGNLKRATAFITVFFLV